MGLGQLLRRAQIREDTGRVFLVDVIDRQLVKPEEKFSWRNVRKAVNRLKNLFGTDFNRDDLWRAFHDLQTAMKAPPQRRDRIFHPSSLLDDCSRKLHYEMGDVPYTDSTVRRIPAQLQRTFDVGTWWHTYIQDALYRAGVLVEAEKTVENKAKRLYGHTDGELCFTPGFPADAPRELLEIKSINSRGYRDIVAAPYEKHVFQASVYASELGFKTIRFIYVNKDTSEMLEHVVPTSETAVKKANEKIDAVLASVESNSPPKRICASRSAKMAQDCPFCTHCFNDPRNA